MMLSGTPLAGELALARVRVEAERVCDVEQRTERLGP
jgi:hypothetical protein